MKLLLLILLTLVGCSKNNITISKYAYLLCKPHNGVKTLKTRKVPVSIGVFATHLKIKCHNGDEYSGKFSNLKDLYPVTKGECKCD